MDAESVLEKVHQRLLADLEEDRTADAAPAAVLEHSPAPAIDDTIEPKEPEEIEDAKEIVEAPRAVQIAAPTPEPVYARKIEPVNNGSSSCPAYVFADLTSFKPARPIL